MNGPPTQCAGWRAGTSAPGPRVGRGRAEGGGGRVAPFRERPWQEWIQPPSGGALTLSFLYTVRMQLKVFP